MICKNCAAVIDVTARRAANRAWSFGWVDASGSRVCMETGSAHAIAFDGAPVTVSRANALAYARLAVNTLMHPDATSPIDFALLDRIGEQVAETLSDMLDGMARA